jgi:hypothetical protein
MAASFGACFSPRSRFAHLQRGLADLRAGSELSNRINLMLAVQSCRQEYFDSLQTQITSISIAFRPDGGAFRDRHGRGAECGGRGWRCRRAAPGRTAKSCGPDAPTLASSWRKTTSAGDGDKQARSPGRARNKPLKPLRREGRVFR